MNSTEAESSIIYNKENEGIAIQHKHIIGKIFQTTSNKLL